jgi:hypothetical protein
MIPPVPQPALAPSLTQTTAIAREPSQNRQPIPLIRRPPRTISQLRQQRHAYRPHYNVHDHRRVSLPPAPTHLVRPRQPDVGNKRQDQYNRRQQSPRPHTAGVRRNLHEQEDRHDDANNGVQNRWPQRQRRERRLGVQHPHSNLANNQHGDDRNRHRKRRNPREPRRLDLPLAFPRALQVGILCSKFYSTPIVPLPLPSLRPPPARLSSLVSRPLSPLSPPVQIFALYSPRPMDRRRLSPLRGPAPLHGPLRREALLDAARVAAGAPSCLIPTLSPAGRFLPSL